MNIYENKETNIYQKISDTYINNWNVDKLPRNVPFYGHYELFSKSKDNNQKRKPKD